MSDDGFTWRAAGAKQPKGAGDAALLYSSAQVGDVVRAEADFGVDGIVLLAIQPPKGARVEKVERIQIVGTSRAEGGVTSNLAPKSERGRGDRRGRRDDGDDRRDRGPRRDGGERGRRDGSERGRRDGGQRGGRGDRPPRGDRSGRAGRVSSDRGTRPGGDATPSRQPRPRPRRLTPGSAHRDAAVAALPLEHRPVAEQVLRGGIPAVRAAVAEQNKNRPEGAPEVHPEGVVSIAEELLPALREAEWRDKAEAAKDMLDEISLRDLRAVVTASDQAARGGEELELAKVLKDSLSGRVQAQKDNWLKEITDALEAGKLVRALKASGRAPDPGTKLPTEIAQRLVDEASAALAPATAAGQWQAVLDAVVASPVRRQVKPVGLPAKPTAPMMSAAKMAAGRVPALTGLLGIDMPPPPPPRGARRLAPPSAKAPSAASSVIADPSAGPSPIESAPVESAPVESAPVEAEAPVAPAEVPSEETGSDPAVAENA